MKRIALIIAFCMSLGNQAFAQGGMGPGPGTVHSAGGASAWTLIANTQTPGGSFGGTSPGINTTGANLIVINVSAGFGVTATLTDNKSNTFTLMVDSNGSVGNISRLYYCIGGTVGTGHTFSITGVTIFAVAEVQAWFDSSGTPVADQSVGNQQASGATISPGAITPTANDSLIVSGLTSQQTSPATINSGFTISDQSIFSAGASYGSAMAYFVQSTAASINPTWSNLISTSGVTIGSFKP